MDRLNRHVWGFDLIHPQKFSAGCKVKAFRGARSGQAGTLVEPVGVEVSWVKWGKNDQTTYPHRSLEVI